MPQAPLRRAEVARVEVDPQPGIALNAQLGHAGDVLQEPPGRGRFGDRTSELLASSVTVPGRRGAARARIVLTGRSRDHAIEAAGDRVEARHVPAVNQVGS